jgi:hypothetical protein
MTRRIIAKVIITLLTIYCISVIIAYFYDISITFPFSVSEGSHVPEHRLKAIRLSVFATFIFFAFHYFFYCSKKFYPIQVMAVLIFNLTIFGTVTFYIEEANTLEFLQLIFYIPASLILYNASKPEIKNIFKKR